MRQKLARDSYIELDSVMIKILLHKCMKKAAVTIIFISQFIKIYLNNKYWYLYLFEILPLQIKKKEMSGKG